MTGGVEVARSRGLPARGEGAKRLALWGVVVGLPLALEASQRLAGPRRYFGGDAAYWFAGLHVDLVLMGGAAALLALALWRSGESLASLKWPPGLRLSHALLLAGTLALALVAAVFYHPAAVSTTLYHVPASTPVTPLERLSLVGMALTDAVVQESVWRGAILTWLAPVLGAPGAVAVSVTSFVFFHPGFGLTWSQVALRLPLAAVYTALVLWRRSIVPSAYLHFILTAGQLLAPVPAH